MSRLRSTLAILVIAAASLAAAAPRAGPQQPDPAAQFRSDSVSVDSVELNLTISPSFTFAVEVPTVLHFEQFDYSGQKLLHIWAFSKDSLKVRIRRAAQYLDTRPGILTPLFETPRGTPIMGYVDRAEFERAIQRALRDPLPARRLSYNRRLS